MAMVDFLGILPELVLLAGAFSILLVLAKAKDGTTAASIAFVTLILGALLSTATLTDVLGLGFMPDATDPATGHAFEDIGVSYEISTFASLLKIVFMAGTAIVVLASPRYMARSTIQAEYYALLLAATVGMMVVASSRDLLTLFLGVEIASFASYVLAGSFKDEPTSSEASMKYFITGALSSTLTLFGISLLYGASAYVNGAGELVSGTLTFDGLRDNLTAKVAAYGGIENAGLRLFVAEPLLAIGVFLVLAGLGFKLTVAPFHMWAPDTYTGSPDTVASFLGGVSKGLGVVALIKVFLWALVPLANGWIPFVAVLAILTMTWGNLVAIKQDDIKRMLAYSSIAQAGYLLIVLPVGTPYAIAGGLFHTVTNLLMKGGAFLVVAAFAYAGIGSRIQDYQGLARRNPYLTVALSVFLLSLAGLPPLGGFWSKFILFSSAVDVSLAGGPGWMWWLAVAGILNSAISLYYYVRWIRTMFTDKTMHPVKVDIPVGLSAAIAVSLVGIVVVGLWVNPVLDWSLRAAEVLAAAAVP